MKWGSDGPEKENEAAGIVVLVVLLVTLSVISDSYSN